MQWTNLFLAVYYVVIDLFDNHIEVGTSNITDRTDNIHVSTWHNWSDDVNVIADIYCVDIKSATATGAGNN